MNIAVVIYSWHLSRWRGRGLTILSLWSDRSSIYINAIKSTCVKWASDDPFKMLWPPLIYNLNSQNSIGHSGPHWPTINIFVTMFNVTCNYLLYPCWIQVWISLNNNYWPQMFKRYCTYMSTALQQIKCSLMKTLCMSLLQVLLWEVSSGTSRCSSSS